MLFVLFTIGKQTAIYRILIFTNKHIIISNIILQLQSLYLEKKVLQKLKSNNYVYFLLLCLLMIKGNRWWLLRDSDRKDECHLEAIGFGFILHLYFKLRMNLFCDWKQYDLLLMILIFHLC